MNPYQTPEQKQKIGIAIVVIALVALLSIFINPFKKAEPEKLVADLGTQVITAGINITDGELRTDYNSAIAITVAKSKRELTKNDFAAQKATFEKNTMTDSVVLDETVDIKTVVYYYMESLTVNGIPKENAVKRMMEFAKTENGWKIASDYYAYCSAEALNREHTVESEKAELVKAQADSVTLLTTWATDKAEYFAIPQVKRTPADETKNFRTFTQNAIDWRIANQQKGGAKKLYPSKNIQISTKILVPTDQTILATYTMTGTQPDGATFSEMDTYLILLKVNGEWKIEKMITRNHNDTLYGVFN